MPQPLLLNWSRVGAQRRWRAEGCGYQVAANDGKTFRVLMDRGGDLYAMTGRDRYRTLHGAQVAAECLEWEVRRACGKA